MFWLRNKKINVDIPTLIDRTAITFYIGVDQIVQIIRLVENIPPRFLRSYGDSASDIAKPASSKISIF